MKKIAILALVLMGLSVSSAFAAYSGSPKVCGSTDTLTVQLSNNVSMEYSAATNGLGYVVGAYHSSGTKTFGTSSGDAKIFYTDTTGATLPSAPTGTASAAFTWTAL